MDKHKDNKIGNNRIDLHTSSAKPTAPDTPRRRTDKETAIAQTNQTHPGHCKQQNITYILECCDGTLYTGWTNNLDKRIHAHNAGTASKYTRARRPVHVVYTETFDTKQEAMRRESQIKKLTRAQKERLISKIL